MLNPEQWTFTQLIWLAPFLFALHNLEEAPQMERWSEKVRLGWISPVNTRQFVIAVTALTAGVLLPAVFAALNPQQKIAVYLLVEVQAILLVNALTHIGATLRFRSYSPGLVTAIMINLPFAVYFLYRAIEEGLLAPNQLVILVLAAPFAMLALTVASLKLGQILGGK
jgi:Sec-independent protein secretion pathway component TatC